jgi:hypothetical protein
MRPRFFPRQLVAATDLNADQTYFRELMRRHNRYLHGCGVVCGLDVLATEGGDGAPCLLVTPGQAISPQGDDIHVPGQQSLPLGAASQCLGPSRQQRLYVALRYHETLAQPVPTLPGPCTLVAGQQFSRLEAGFQLACLAELPAGCGEPPSCGDLTCELLRATPPSRSPCAPADCPPDDAGSWVVLAAVKLDAAGGVEHIDYSVRRRVLSVQFLQEALRCLLPKINAITPAAGSQGVRMLALIGGKRLADARSVQFKGSDISAQIVPRFNQDDQILILMDIASNATLGPRGFLVTTPRGAVNSAACGVQFTVLPRPMGYGYGYAYAVYGSGGHMMAGIGGDQL